MAINRRAQALGDHCAAYRWIAVGEGRTAGAGTRRLVDIGRGPAVRCARGGSGGRPGAGRLHRSQRMIHNRQAEMLVGVVGDELFLVPLEQARADIAAMKAVSLASARFARP